MTAEIATAEGWWYKPDYIINELNINSAIASPGHLEVLPLKGKGQTYTIKGYCYNGGGRKVIRVEVSLDGGATWTLTKLNHPETPTEYGKYWCWCFFEHEIDVSELYQLKHAEVTPDLPPTPPRRRPLSTRTPPRHVSRRSCAAAGTRR